MAAHTEPRSSHTRGRLRRGLGLYSVFSISIGAMIGSGIFVLPGLAAAFSGPAVILAYVLAGVIVIPAALAMAEMSTAMPRAGGTYLYIDLAMGPLMGTIAGFGVWFSLVFKAAFALDGLGAYLGIFTEFGVEAIALAIGVVLIAVNLVGVHQSGMVQAVLVSAVFGVLLIFIGGGAIEVDSSRYHPFFQGGFEGVLKTVGFVFVSYAGVTKVASVAEEVDRPGRTLPVAIISSLLVMIFVYPAVVFVMVGVSPMESLVQDLTPMAGAAGRFLPSWTVYAVGVTAILALASMANAGLLASSRYPFAMARRRLAPPIFSRIGRSNVPTTSLLLTGALLLLLVAFVPILEIAKLASAFQLLVLGIVNIALLTFRSSNLWWYRPSFRAPGYPWLQILGIVVSVVLIGELGADALIGAVLIIGGGALWYQVYGRSRAIKESALREAVRQRTMTRLLAWTEIRLRRGADRMVVASPAPASDPTLLRIAGSLAEDEADMALFHLSEGADVVSHLGGIDAELILTALDREHKGLEHLVPEGFDVVALVGDLPASIDTIAVLGSGGPFDVLKMSLAARLARGESASLRFVHILDGTATAAQRRAIESYHGEVAKLCEVPTESVVRSSDDLIEALVEASGDADLAIVGAPPERRFLSDLGDRIVAALDRPVLLVGTTRPPEDRALTRIWRRVGRIVSGADSQPRDLPSPASSR